MSNYLPLGPQIARNVWENIYKGDNSSGGIIISTPMGIVETPSECIKLISISNHHTGIHRGRK